MSALLLEVNIGTVTNEDWQEIITSDMEISLSEESPLWNDASLYSDNITVPLEPNRHWLSTACNIHGCSIYSLLYKKRFRLYLAEHNQVLDRSKHLFREGVVQLDDEVDFEDDEFDMELSSGKKTLDDLLSGISARDITPRDNDGNRLVIGECHAEDPGIKINGGIFWYFHTGIWCLYPEVTKVQDSLSHVPAHKTSITLYGQGILNQVIVSNKEEEKYINTTSGYDPTNNKVYCNVPIVFQRYIKNGDNWEKERGYQKDNAGDADRPDSAPCFFVLAWLKWLFHQVLGANSYNEASNPLMKLCGFDRLCMVHTDCHYEVGEKINDDEFRFGKNGPSLQELISIPSCIKSLGDAEIRLIISSIEIEDPHKHAALATGDNFPDTDAKSLLESILSVADAKVIYDEFANTVKIVLMNDVLQENLSTDLNDSIDGWTAYKKENYTQGVRIKFSAASEVEQNALTGDTSLTSGGDDSTYNYNDYTRLQHMSKYAGKTAGEDKTGYGYLITHISPFDKKCYYDDKTGETYRIKVDSDATTVKELFPSLFSVAGLHSVEVGNCSDNDRVEEISIQWSPITTNDKNYEKEKEYFKSGVTSSETDKPQPLMTVFTSQELYPDQDNAQTITYDLNLVDIDSDTKGKSFDIQTSITEGKKYGVIKTPGILDILVNTELTQVIDYATWTVAFNYHDTVMSWDFSNGFDNPLLSDDFGTTFGVLREGSEQGKVYYTGETTSEGTCEWYYSGGVANGQVTSDNYDAYGNGNKGDLCLKLQAEKPNPDYIYNDNIRCTRRQTWGGVYYIKDGGIVETKRDAVTGEYYEGISQDLTIDSLSNYLTERAKLAGKEDSVSGFTFVAQEYTDAIEALEGGDGTRVQMPKTEYGWMENTRFMAEITDPNCSHRGLYDKYYALHAHWLINRKIAVITIPRGCITLETYKSLEWTQKYTIGNITGFINKKSCTIDNDGLSDVELEIYYI